MQVDLNEPAAARAQFAASFLDETIDILRRIDANQVECVVDLIGNTRRDQGRLFLCGSGGGAGHASHAACDFRKLSGVEAYCVTDNVSELTARVNDNGWDRAYADWLEASRLCRRDCLFVFSVGGGDRERGVSVNLINAMTLAREQGASIAGIAGRSGGELRRLADACILIPTGRRDTVTAQTEGLQAVLWHLIVTHPKLLSSAPRWESLEDDAAR